MTQTTLREYLRTTEDAISSGRIEEAMANCQNILTYFPEALEAQRLLGEVYLAQGQMEEAQQTFEWILTNDPENVIVYCDRALISERTSDIDTALDCYQQAYELSRGNANIRQEFNQLSARVGQQEFMFSRAGLARLYMRGDLLTQAIQEWDAVLAISPDRLDARLGIMETYWREGTYDKAEQVATQLLEEVPTCLKALLYLAHITSISNIQRAVEFLQRAEALDPDLVMAQEIFSDLAASQPNDPFLALLRKEPIQLENGRPINVQPASPPVQVSQPISGEHAFDNWDKPTQINISTEQSMPETPTRVNWNNSAEELSTTNSSAPEMPAAWQAQVEPLPPDAANEQPWYQTDPFATVTADPNETWNNRESSQADLSSWDNEVQEEDAPTPPAWLGTLTRSEQQQQAAAMQPAAPEIKPQAQPEEEPMPFFLPAEDENDSEMGWPEWLKSLGAETLEPEPPTPSEALPEIETPPLGPVAEVQSWEDSRSGQSPSLEANPWAALPAISANNEAAWAEPNNQPEWIQQIAPMTMSSAQGAAPEWMQQFSAVGNTPVQGATPEWMQQFSDSQSQDPYQSSAPEWMQQFSKTESQSNHEPAIPTNEQEQHYLTSLEDLEKDLQSQGFVPMAPGSLASIAQAQEDTQAQSQQNTQSSLSSALAQLGNFAQSSPTPQSDDPWWSTMSDPVADQPTSAIPKTPSEPLSPFAALGAATTDETQRAFSPLPATPTPLSSAPGFSPNTGQPLTPAYRSDALLDSDLETTMKRPAITLERMQSGERHGERSYTNGKGHNERKPFDPVEEGNLSNHERLVRGYQYQLSGAYDESMQEYRVIIRNAPELLEDVISNLRALLKINPRFSLGYRVLGDAYMRKGEYLQAMESYNKALTMAKKARN